MTDGNASKSMNYRMTMFVVWMIISLKLLAVVRSVAEFLCFTC